VLIIGEGFAGRGSAPRISGFGMGGEERPNQISGGYFVAAERVAGPHMMSALDSIECHSSAILASGV